jgi:hypothetical protein
MTISLYDAFVPSCLQMLGALDGLLDKASAYCVERNIDPAELFESRLIDDMYPFAYQVRATVKHSIGAIDAFRKGQYTIDQGPSPTSFSEMKALIAGAIARLSLVDPAELEGWTGRRLSIEAPGHTLIFDAENFLLSAAQPNFYFHVTMTYALLRMKGLPVGKLDFIGIPRVEA